MAHKISDVIVLPRRRGRYIPGHIFNDKRALNRPSLPKDLEVFVESYDPQGKASYAAGYFLHMNVHMNFNCIMMDEYGGPNVAVVLPEETQTMLRELGLDSDAVDNLITTIQRKIMEGEAHVQLRDDTNESK